MTDSPRERRYQDREAKILKIARRIAEQEGWASVTTRRLAEEIDYSQPVIYQHFGSRDILIQAVVKQGFAELTAIVHGLPDSETAPLESLCQSYLDFGKSNPALYGAMFTHPTELPFAQVDTPAQLRESFGALAEVIAYEADLSDEDEISSVTELFWAACHGLTSLHMSGRIPGHHLDAQIARVCSMTRGELPGAQ